MSLTFKLFVIIYALYYMHVLNDIRSYLTAIHKDVEALELHLRFLRNIP